AFEVSVSNGFYLGAIMLHSLEIMEDIPDGMLVVLLSWHHAIVLPVKPGLTTEIVDGMRAFAKDLDGNIEVQPAERLSTDVFLWRKGREMVVVDAWPPAG